MPTTITADGNLDVNSKNLMLNEWRVKNRSVFAANAAGDQRSTTESNISFGQAENGRISLSSPFTLTVDNNSEGSDAIKKIIIEPLTGTDGGGVFELDEAIDFPAGGSIFIPLIEIELEND